MNFALLGDDAAVVPLLEAVACSSEHALTCVTLAADPVAARVLRIAPAARVVGQWEELLSDAQIDAAIVAGHEADVLEAARRLAAAGKPLLILPDVRQGLAFIYELTLIRDDSGVVLCPAFRERFDPAVRRLKELIGSGRLGPLLHLQLERRSGPTSLKEGSVAPPPNPQAEIDEALFRDVDLLRQLGGDYNQVTALYTGAGQGVVSMANVTLAGEGLPPVAWSLKATPLLDPPWKLMAIGEKHTVALSRAEDGSAFRLDADDVELADSAPDAGSVRGTSRDERPTASSIRSTADDVGESLLARFVSMTAGRAPNEGGHRPKVGTDRRLVSVHSDWSDLTQAFELVDAARRSVVRRRTIDVYFETASERNVFKTQMTAIGCGLLVATFLAVLLLLLVGELFEPSPVVMHVLRILVFLPLLVFLALQLLVVIARPSAVETGSGPEETD